MGSCASSQARRKKTNQIDPSDDSLHSSDSGGKVHKQLIANLDEGELDNLRDIVREKYSNLSFEEVDRLIEKYLQDAQLEKDNNSTAERTVDYSPDTRLKGIGEPNLSFLSLHRDDSELKEVTPRGRDSETPRSPGSRANNENEDSPGRKRQPPLMYNPQQKSRDINTLKLLEIFPTLSYYTIVDAFHRYDWDVDLTADYLQKMDRAAEGGYSERGDMNGLSDRLDSKASRRHSTTHSDFMPSDSDLLEAICKLKYIDDDEVHVQALRTLCDLSLNEELQKKISDFGGLAPIATILERKIQYYTEKSNEIVHLATGSLANLALLEEKTDYFACRRLCDVAIEGLDMEDSTTLANCARVLANLAFNNPENESLIAEAGGIPCLVALLDRAKDHNVIMETLAALGNMARNKKYQTAICKGQGLAAIMKHIKIDVPDIQQQALRVAGNLCMSKKIRKVFTSEGGVSSLEEIVRESQDQYTVKLCMLTVANMSMDFSLQPEMVSSGLFEAVVNNLSNEKMNNYEIYIHIIRFFGSLSENVKVREVFDGKKEVINFILRFRDEADREIQTIIDHFLTNLGYESD